MKQSRSGSSIVSIIKEDSVQTDFSLQDYKEDFFLAEKERLQSGIKRKELLESLRKSVSKNETKTLYSILSNEIDQAFKTGSFSDLERIALSYQKEITNYSQKKLLSKSSLALFHRFNDLIKMLKEKNSFLEKINKNIRSLQSIKREDSPESSPSSEEKPSPLAIQELTLAKLSIISTTLQDNIDQITKTLVPVLDALDKQVSADQYEQAFYFSTFFTCLSVFDEVYKKKILNQYQAIAPTYSHESQIQFFRDTLKNLCAIKRETADLLHFCSRKQARGLVREGQYQQAITILCQSLLIWRDDAETYRMLASLFFRQKDEPKAYTALGEALRLCPDDIPLRKRMASYWVRQGKPEKAIREYHEILKRNPQDFRARRELGKIYYKNKLYEKTISILIEYIKHAPSDWECHYWLADSFMQTGDIQHAIPHGEKALELASGNTKIIHMLSLCYRRLGMFEDAIRLLEEKQQQFPTSEGLLIQLAISYQEYEKWQDAERCYLQFLFQQDSFLIRTALAYVQTRQEKWEAATENYEKALELNDNHKETYLAFGQFLRRRGLDIRAEEILRKAWERFPKDQEIKQELIVLYTEMNRWKEAMEFMQTDS